MKTRCSEAFMSKFKHIRLAGTDHEPHITNIEKWGWPGEIPFFILNRERQNEYDPNAIGVFFTIDRIGYIPKELAVILAPLMDDGHKFDAILESRNTCDWSNRVGLTVTIVEVT
jgi:hypothetical protein